MNKKTTILLLISLALLAAGCTKPTVNLANFPPECKPSGNTDVPKFFSDLLYPDSLVTSSITFGGELESRSTGETMGGSDSQQLSLCAKGDPETILAWYKEKLSQKGYDFKGKFDETTAIWMKGTSTFSTDIIPTVIGDGFIMFMIGESTSYN